MTPALVFFISAALYLAGVIWIRVGPRRAQRIDAEIGKTLLAVDDLLSRLRNLQVHVADLVWRLGLR